MEGKKYSSLSLYQALKAIAERGNTTAMGIIRGRIKMPKGQLIDFVEMYKSSEK